MPKSYPIQSSFAAGEISPKLYGRIDKPGYQEGLLTCFNMMVDSRGPVYKRPGFEHLLSFDGTQARIFHYDYSRDESYLVVLKDREVMVSAPTTPALGPNELVNGSFDQGLDDWLISEVGQGSVTVGGPGWIEIDPSKASGSLASVYQTISLTDALLDHVVSIAGEFKSPAGTPLQLLVGTGGEGSSDIHSHDLEDGGFKYQFQLPGPISEPVTITISGVGWDVGGNPDTASRIEAVGFQGRSEASSDIFRAPTPYLGEELSKIQAELTPDGKSMVFTHNNHPVQELNFDPVGLTWVWQTRGFTGEPSEWAPGNYPNTSTFFQGRHWFAGTPLNPETMWASQSGSYKDLTVGVNADDGLQFTISDHGLIGSLVGAKDLLVNTTRKEFILTSREGVITPTDIQVEQQSAYGSAPVKSQLMGTEALFINSDNTKLRSQWYQWTEAGYLARDISYTNDHILQGKVVQFAFQKEPDQAIWLVLDTGELVGCTYHRDGNDKPTFGWHKHRIPEGDILDVAPVLQAETTGLAMAFTTKVNGVDQVHVTVASPELVLRVTEPNGYRESEATKSTTFSFHPNRQSNGSVSVISGQGNIKIYVDDFIHILSDGTTTLIQGLEHLEGKIVQAVNDGAVENLKLVVNGEINLDAPGLEIIVGLPYSSEMVTLPLVSPAPGGGSTAGWQKNRNKVTLRMLESAMPIINGERPAERRPSTPMNTVEELRTLDVSVSTLGWDHYRFIRVEQDLPKPLVVTAIFGDASQETL